MNALTIKFQVRVLVWLKTVIIFVVASTILLLPNVATAEVLQDDSTVPPQGKIVAGYQDGFGVIDPNGDLWMWGNVYLKNYANGGATRIIRDDATVVRVMGDVTSASFCSGNYAAIKRDGSLWMWGGNDFGQVGDGTKVKRTEPVKIMDDVIGVSTGLRHSGAIKSDGSLWMWGDNYRNQLGDGTSTSRLTPVKIMDDVVAVSCGSFHSAAIKSDGSLWMWGENGAGEIGVGYSSWSLPPTKIMDDVKKVYLFHEYSYAIKSDGSLWSWGDNSYGFVGTGTTQNQYEPVKIMDGVADVGDGIAIDKDGSLWTWSTNWPDQVGDSATASSYRPRKVMDGVVDVAPSHFHYAIVKNDGSLWVWVHNLSNLVNEWPGFVKISDDFSVSGTNSSNAADDDMIERVRMYTSGGEMEFLERLFARDLSNEELIQRLNAFYSLYGITDPREGIEYVTRATGYQRAYRYLVGNDNYLAYNWLDWLYNTPLGQATRGKLYADGLIYNWEVGDYINPLTYANNRLPGVEKYRTVLKEFLEVDDSSKWSDGFSASKGMAKALANLAKVNEMTQDAELGLLMDRILDCTSEAEVSRLQTQYAETLLRGVKASGKGNVVLDMPTVSEACGYASSAISFVSATADDIVAMVNLEADVERYESHRRFLERVIDDPEVGWELRTAAASLLDEIENGYRNRIVSIMSNAIELQNGILSTNEELMGFALEKAGVSEATSGLISGALSTLKFGVFVSNIVIDMGDVNKQAAYTQAFAELGASFAWRLEQDKAAFLADQSAENAWTFFEDYTTLWKLRQMGEEQYRDMGKIKMFIFGSVPRFGYNHKAELVADTLRNLDQFRFDLSGGIAVPEGVQYEQKAVFHCPVDVEVRASDGTLVATMRDGEESDVTNEHGRFAVVRDSYSGEYAKVVCLAGAGDYTFVAKGTDLGLMSVQYDRAGLADVQGIDNVDIAPQTSASARFDSPTDRLVCEVDPGGDGTYETTLQGHASADGDARQDVESIACDPAKLDMTVGDEALLSVTARPSGSTCQNAYWVSLDEGVATVRNGKVVAQGAGSTTVLCVSQSDTGLVAECEVNVKAAPIDISGADVSGVDAWTYDAIEHEVQPVVRLGDDTLVPNTDYIVSGDVTATNAGTHSVVVTGTGAYAGTKTINYTVSPKEVEATVAVEPAAFAYDGNDHFPASCVVKDGETTIPPSEYVLSPIVAGTSRDVGTYDYAIADAEGGNYVVSGSATYEITPKPIALGVSLDGWTYGQEPNDPSVTGNEGGAVATYEYKRRDADDGEYSADVPTGAGTYTVRATVPAAGNYAAGSATCDFEIARAASAVTQAPEAVAGLSYTGGDLTLVSAGSATGGTLEYSADGESWGEGLPAGRDAGSYRVWYRVVGDDNHEDAAAAGPVAAGIAKSEDPAAVVPSATVIRGGNAVELSALVTGAEGSVTYAIDGEARGCSVGEGTGTFTSGVEPATVTVRVTVAESANRTGKTAAIDVTVSEKATAALDVAQRGATYGDELPAPAYEAPAGSTTMLSYSGTTRAGAAYGPAAEAPTDAGTYAVTVTCETTDTVHAGTARFSIAPAPMGEAVVTLGDALTYDGKAQTQRVVSVLVGSADITGFCVVSGDVATDAGDYDLTVTARPTSNYEGSVTCPFSVARAAYSPGAVTAGIVRDSLDPAAVVLDRSDTSVPGRLAISETELSYGTNTYRWEFVPADSNHEPSSGTVEVTVTGHEWGAPTYRWAEGDVSCTARRVCANDHTHAEEETVVPVRKVVSEPTVEREGKATLTAEFRNAAFGTRSKEVVLPRLPATVFPDVPEGSWFHGVVYRAAALGLFSGYGDGRFGPNDKVTRGQVAVILWNMAGRPAPKGTPKAFPDVVVGKYYYQAVRWASSVGVVSGYDSGKFGPEDPVAREQLAAMLANYAARVSGRDVSGSAADYRAMKDVAKVSGWAQKSVGWCFRSKILSGTGDGCVNPQGNATRAEAAKMVVLLHDMP